MGLGQKICFSVVGLLFHFFFIRLSFLFVCVLGYLFKCCLISACCLDAGRGVELLCWNSDLLFLVCPWDLPVFCVFNGVLAVGL